MARENQPHVGRPFDGPVRASQMNDVFQQISNFKSMSVTRPLTLTQTAGGGVRLGIQLPKPVKAVAAVAAGTTIKQFQIRGSSTQSDAILCFPDNGIDEIDISNKVWVAKPWFLRGKGTWEGESRKGVTYSDYIVGNQTRTATSTIDPGDSELQTIIPGYVSQDIIVAALVGTGVIEPGTEDDEDGPTMVKWLDLNTTGRMWAMVPE